MLVIEKNVPPPPGRWKPRDVSSPHARLIQKMAPGDSVLFGDEFAAAAFVVYTYTAAGRATGGRFVRRGARVWRVQ